SAKHSHTTHVLSTATIHYAHHAHYGVTVTRMRKCSSFGLHQVQVALPSGMQILIPEWMLDEDRCRGMEIVVRPTLAITALFALRELVDAQRWTPPPTGTVASVASSPGGAFDEPTTPGSSALGDSTPTGVAAGHTTALLRAPKSLAAGSREHDPDRHRGGER
ncbi:MAG: hypothetical protein WA651_04510, partial [Candidatus Sulfotelmatobacter sp.]